MAGIWSAAHKELLAVAQRAGVVYKPSGAGGGDYGLAFAIERERLAEFGERASAAGYSEAVPGWSDTGLEVSVSR